MNSAIDEVVAENDIPKRGCLNRTGKEGVV